MSGAEGRKPIRSDRTVASVDGTAIQYAEVRLEPAQLERGCRLNHEFGTARPGPRRLESLRLGLERARLKNRIVVLVREQTARELGLSFGEEEVSQVAGDRLEDLLRGLAPEELQAAVGRELARHYRLREALRAVQRGVAAGEAYRRFQLDDSQPLWAFRVGAGCGELAGGQRVVSRPLPATGSLRERLLEQSLNDRIDAQLGARDPDYRRYLEAESRGDLGTLRAFFRTNPLFQQIKRAEWWAERLSRARIEIRASRFLPVLAELRSR